MGPPGAGRTATRRHARERAPLMEAPPRTRPYLLDEQVGFILRRVSQRHAAIFQDAVPDGLTPTQFSALIRLSEVGPTSQNQLGRLASMDVATIKGVVARLFAKGLVTIAPDPQDKRRTTIALSEAGADLIDDLHDAGQHITEATLAPLSAEERAIFLKLLQKLS